MVQVRGRIVNPFVGVDIIKICYEASVMNYREFNIIKVVCSLRIL